MRIMVIATAGRSLNPAYAHSSWWATPTPCSSSKMVPPRSSPPCRSTSAPDLFDLPDSQDLQGVGLSRRWTQLWFFFPFSFWGYLFLDLFDLPDSQGFQGVGLSRWFTMVLGGEMMRVIMSSLDHAACR